jgi:hypothetical protein
MQHDPYQTTFADMLGRGAELRVTENQQRVTAAETAPSRISRRLTRSQVIDRIVAINTSATTAFLERFETPSLHRYLEHLDVASGPRGRLSAWQRPGDSPAIMTFEDEEM